MLRGREAGEPDSGSGREGCPFHSHFGREVPELPTEED